LLADDGLHQGAQVILPLTIRETAGTNLLDERAKDRIDAHQVAASAAVVVWRQRAGVHGAI
jgi:hypothetical protein